jgi:ligand-binding SRPBCC domain-containing protein
MIKFLKFLGIIIGLTIIFILVSGLFVSKDFHFERSVSIRAPREEVWKNVSLFSNFEKWDPWRVRDTAMTRSIEGTDGTVGASYTWKGNKEVGSGKQTFLELHPFDLVVIDLVFLEPFESNARVSYRLVPTEKGTRITWSFDSKMPYPFNAVCYFFMDMEAMMDKDFSSGLANLKRLCESNVTQTALLIKKPEGSRNDGRTQLLRHGPKDKIRKFP